MAEDRVIGYVIVSSSENPSMIKEMITLQCVIPTHWRVYTVYEHIHMLIGAAVIRGYSE